MKRKYLILFSLSGFVLSFDQLTKQYISTHYDLGFKQVLIPGFLSLVRVHNSGFAFGFLQHATESLREIFVIGVPAFALVLIVLIFIKLRDNQMLTSVALTSILGGAVGNLIDRMHYGYVLDFLDFHVGELVHLPPFNIADCSIIIGVGLMFLNTLYRGSPQDAP